jgi:RNA polymerase sigma-70 factor, ECF subfamily
MTDLRDRDTAAIRLLEQTAQGDQQAFEELCRIYRGPLFKQAFNMLGNAETADEVVQDVFLGIWRGAKHFKGESKPFSWMWAILRNKAVGVLRITQRSTETTNNQDPDEVFLRNPEMDAVICQGLCRLSVEHRLSVILTYYLNLSQAQISELMHCPVGTVKSRLSNALKQLREVWVMP